MGDPDDGQEFDRPRAMPTKVEAKKVTPKEKKKMTYEGVEVEKPAAKDEPKKEETKTDDPVDLDKVDLAKASKAELEDFERRKAAEVEKLKAKQNDLAQLISDKEKEFAAAKT